jgi:hypothetical protein
MSESAKPPNALLGPDALNGLRIAISASESPDLGRLGLVETHFPNERVEHEAVAPGAVLDGVCHEGDRLHGRVHRELITPARLETVFTPA